MCTDKRGCGPHFELYYNKLFKELLFKNSLALILSSLIMLLNAYIEIQIRKGCVSGGGGVKITEQFLSHASCLSFSFTIYWIMVLGQSN